MSETSGPGTQWLKRQAARDKTERAFQEMTEEWYDEDAPSPVRVSAKRTKIDGRYTN
jgi:hypothetical protein